MPSLWGEEFEIKPTQTVVKKVKEKISKAKELKVVTSKTIHSKSISIQEKLRLITEEVYRILGVYINNTEIITTKEQLVNYIDAAISNGVIAIDTETNNSLDPITCKLMGACIYTPGQKNAYIPVNHTTLDGVRLEYQLTEQDIKEQFERLYNTKIIMHNGKFDYKVIKCTCDISLHLDWDTMIGSRLLDENEKSAGLKQQYISKIDPSIEKYSIDHLFKDVSYAIVDPNVFALYAATDAYMTYKLYLWQKEQFELNKNKELLKSFHDIEVPVSIVCADMELTGVCLDTNYAQELSSIYHKKLNDIEERISQELLRYKEKIDTWKMTPEATEHSVAKKPNVYGEYKIQKSKSEQLEDPVNVSSPTQLAILLYDILDLGVVDKKSPRGTGEDILQKLYEKNKDIELLNLILESRHVLKQLSTYIDKLPNCLNSKTGRIHCNFNSYGADTGRMSSSDPNLQNISSKDNNIRKMFVASEGYVLMSSDFSQQEPKSLAALCRMAGDSLMYDVFMQGKDLYSEIASKAFNKSYEECLEFNPDGTTNKEGKQRRTQAKSILLGVLYGRGEASIAEQLHCTIDEARNIKESVFNGFPAIRQFESSSLQMAHDLGYVTTIYGRRRRLPDINLPKYEIKLQKGENNFNPLLYTKGIFTNKDNPLIKKYQNLLQSARSYKEVDKIKLQAAQEGVVIQNNGGFIAQAERQCVNARIQGSAADLTKAAMIDLHYNERAREIGLRILIPVHDELIVECPYEYAKEGKELLASVMSTAAQKILDIPIKCDVAVSKCWYGEEINLE